MVDKIVKINLTPTEEQEQIKFCVWLDKNQILYYSVPNGGSRHMIEALKLKRTGLKAGVPDICIPVPSGQWHGLYIEMKRIKNSNISDTQRYWLEKLQKNGYCAEIAYGFEQAKSIVRNYFKGYDDMVLAS